MAAAAAQYWQDVSAKPQPAPAAIKQQVLDSVRAAGVQCPAATAMAAGDAAILEGEIKKALSMMKAGKSPGLDGIPVELWRLLQRSTTPILARLFTAVGELGLKPHGFLDGVIITLYKKGDRSDPASYRPITLLNTDYKVLAKVLANRLGPVLGGLLGQEQTAFLPRRLIGSNILLLQQLPQLLRQAQQSAVVAFLDFRKAYDTVDRDFLAEVMAAVGMGAGLMRWARLLLTDTRACVEVNGHISPKVCMAAGVRQGCPLSPMLYLFIAHALLCWLRAKGVGVCVRRLRLDAAQYADDAEVVLPSMQSVPAFMEAMQQFAAASNQHLNVSKVELLPVGAPGAPAAQPPPQQQQAAPLPMAAAAAAPQAAASLAGAALAAPQMQQQQQQHLQQQQQQQAAQLLVAAAAAAPQAAAPPAGAAPAAPHMQQQQQQYLQQQQQQQQQHAAAAPAADQPAPAAAVAVELRVVQQAQSLGVLFSNAAAAAPDAAWQCRITKVRSCIACLAAMHLSAFGRASTVSAYALGQLPYAAEFTGWPDGCTDTHRLLQQAAMYVDSGRAPAAAPAPGDSLWLGVPMPLLYGSPRIGGFGLLPLKEHVRARHASWTAAFIKHSMQPAPQQPPWVRVAAALLHEQHVNMQPLALAATAGRPQGWSMCLGQPLPATCAAFGRLVQGLTHLPPVVDVAEEPLVADTWCYEAPLWGNPLLPTASNGSSLEQQFPHLLALPFMDTVGWAVRFADAVALLWREQRAYLSPRTLRQAQRLYRSVIQPRCLRGAPADSPLYQVAVAHQQLSALLEALPTAWVAAARQVYELIQVAGPQAQQVRTMLGIPDRSQVADMLFVRLGWKLGPGLVCPLGALTVKVATNLQMREAWVLRARLIQAFVREARGWQPNTIVLAEDEGCVLAAFARLWKLRWENYHKEAFWRIAVDGFHYVGGTHHPRYAGQHACVCPCGSQGDVGPRMHHFWLCPVAINLVNFMMTHLGQVIDRSHLWLLQQPLGVLEPVWDVVGLAALSALEYGRKRLWAASQAQHGTGELIGRVGAAVVADFMARLVGFAALGRAPKGWRNVHAHHPFLGVDLDGRLRVNIIPHAVPHELQRNDDMAE